MNKAINNASRPCGLFRRFAVIFYDGVVVVALLIVAAALALLAGVRGRTAMIDPVYTAYLVSVWYFYLAWCWHKGSMTVGMRAWRVKIEDCNGQKPGWGKSAIRFVVSLVSAGLAGLGFFWSLFDADKRTWHDIVSGTRLVRY